MVRLIVGCGYLGERVARLWREAGDEVYTVTRSEERAAALAVQGFRPLVADVFEPGTLARLPAADTVLYAVGHERTAGQPIETLYAEGLNNVLKALPRATGRFIYISSTGVYGERAGDWVDEETECRPARAGGRACLAAERMLAASPLADRLIVLRLAGIYGPGRIPRKEALRAGEPIAAPSEGWLNLIHVDDAAAVVVAAARAHVPLPRWYVVADGHPVERREYYAELARLVGAPPPRFVPPPKDDPASQRAASSKRIDNRRMLAELGVRLAYPSFREGLAGTS